MEAVLPEVCEERHRNIKEWQDRYKDIPEVVAVQTEILSTLKDIVKDLQAKPGLRWDTIVNTIISGSVGAALVMFLK